MSNSEFLSRAKLSSRLNVVIFTITSVTNVTLRIFAIVEVLSNILSVLRKYHEPIIIVARNGIIKYLCLPKSASTMVLSSMPGIAICSFCGFLQLLENHHLQLNTHDHMKKIRQLIMI